MSKTGMNTARTALATVRALRTVALRDERVILLLSTLSFLLFWQWSTQVFGGVEYFSTPLLVAEGIYGILFITGDAWPHVIATTQRIVLAFAFTLVAGLLVGVLMGVMRFWGAFFSYAVTLMLSTPSLVAVVFTAMMFGSSYLTPIVATILLTTPLISLTIRDSVEDIDPNLLEMSGAFHVPRHSAIWRVVVKSIAPAIFGTTRYAFSVAWKITNLTEVVIADVGVGFQIRFFFRRLDTTGILQYVLLLSLLILLVEYGVLRPIENHVFAHREDISIGFGGVGSPQT